MELSFLVRGDSRVSNSSSARTFASFSGLVSSATAVAAETGAEVSNVSETRKTLQTAAHSEREMAEFVGFTRTIR